MPAGAYQQQQKQQNGDVLKTDADAATAGLGGGGKGSVHAAVSVSANKSPSGPPRKSEVSSPAPGSRPSSFWTNQRFLRCAALTFVLVTVAVATYLNVTELPLGDFYAQIKASAGFNAGMSTMTDDMGGAVDVGAGADNPEGGIDYTGSKVWVPEGTDMELDAHSFPLVLESTFLDIYGPASTPPAETKSVTPVFFHVPQGGLVAERVIVGCWDLTSAFNAANMLENGGLGIIAPDVLLDSKTNNKYVNVNMMTTDGIVHAGEIGLASSGLAEVIITPHLHVGASSLLSPEYRGRLSALLRHPVERAVATYVLLTSNPKSPAYNEQVAGMTIEQYAESLYMERNWLTRFLSEPGAGSSHPITPSHARVAKEVLRRKTLVGLYDRTDESLTRMQQYYGWNKRGESDQAIKCRREAMAYEDTLRSQLPAVAEGDPAWNAIMKGNQYDMEVYEYALSLWEEQDGLYHTEP